MSAFASIRQDIQDYLAANYDIALDSVAPESTLEDLGFDSLGLLGIATLLENKYGIKFDTASMFRVATLADLMELVKAKSVELD